MVSISNKRKERDLMKLMMSNYEVTIADEEKKFDFYVVFPGPKDSAYEGVSHLNIKLISFKLFYSGSLENSCHLT